MEFLILVQKKNTILYVGRISPVKKVDVLINAANILHEKGVDFTLFIAGIAQEQDHDYFKTIVDCSRKLEQKGKIKFLGKIPHNKTPEIYNACQLVVNLTETGSFDKTILEAMACETMVLVSNRTLERVLPEECMFTEGDAENLAEKIVFLLNLPTEVKQAYGKKFRKHVLEEHAVDQLIDALLAACEK